MTLEDAKEEIKIRIPMEKYLVKSKYNQFCCPYCDSGNHDSKDSTGALHVYPETQSFHCFSCDKSGDVIDLYQNQTGTDFITAVREMASMIGISLDPYRPEEKTEKKNPLPPKVSDGQTQKKDFSRYYEVCSSHITDTKAVEYLNGRGISLETAQKCNLGYDPASDPAAAPGGAGEIRHPEPRIIIPTAVDHYVGRAIRADIDKAWTKMNPAGSHPGIFNIDQIKTATSPVFVVEGAFDALSLMEVGATAVALNSTSNAEKFLDFLKENPPKVTFILSMDNDSAGKNATATLKQGLQQQNIPFSCSNIAGEYKDVNERLTADKEGLIEAVKKALQLGGNKPDNTSSYLEQAFASEIKCFNNNLKTGFSNLDEKSDGLYAGLYILAATSSLGKTTFLGQVCDQIAQSGTDVLYFSIEQSRLEMVSKSLARLTFQTSEESAATSLSIRKGNITLPVRQAIKDYCDNVSDRVSIIEGNFTCSATYIGDYVRNYIAKNGVKPVVIIDYLQILAPEEINGRYQTTKEVVDTTIVTLKRISRDLGITVIAVSSINRANYLYPIDLEALKESGNLEYTADVIWGLQLSCITCDPVFINATNITKKREIVRDAKAANPRQVDLVCLKNRYGIANFKASFLYYPAHDTFVETDEFPDFEDFGPADDVTPKAGRKIGGR